MEKQYELSTGILECYPLYAVFHFNSDFYDLEEAEELTKIIDSHYRDLSRTQNTCFKADKIIHNERFNSFFQSPEKF